MSIVAIVLIMATSLYAMRLSGFALADVTIPADLEQTLGYVPLATLTALVIASLAGRDDHLSLGIVAALAAAGIAYRIRRTWVCIVGGMLVYWLLLLMI